MIFDVRGKGSSRMDFGRVILRWMRLFVRQLRISRCFSWFLGCCVEMAREREAFL